MRRYVSKGSFSQKLNFGSARKSLLLMRPGDAGCGNAGHRSAFGLANALAILTELATVTTARSGFCPTWPR